MSTREVVTLQIGHYANFVGTHVWNLQSSAYSNLNSSSSSPDAKEINFDVTFREGRTVAGETTYTPRAVFFDLKGSLNTLKQDGVLYDFKLSETDTKWPENVTRHEVAGACKNEFLLSLEKEEMEHDLPSSSKMHEKDSETFNLDSVVKVWSDFLKPHLHPKSVNTITHESHANAENFVMHETGMDAYKHERSEVENRLHFFVEECDSLQGFQLLIDAYNAFGGFASHLYEDYIEEEFKNKGCLSVINHPFALKPTVHPCSTSLVNLLLTIDTFYSSSGILPLSMDTTVLYKPSRNPSHATFPFLDFNPSLPYHSSAILATAFNNATLPYRLVSHPSDLGHHISSITSDRRKLLGLQLSLPFALEDGNTIFDFNQHKSSSCTSFPEFTSLTPSMANNGRISLQNVTISGLSNEQLFGSQVRTGNVAHSSAEDLMQEFLIRNFNTTTNNLNLIRSPCRIAKPFPNIFSRQLGHSGIPLACKRPSSDSALRVSSIPVATLLQNNDGVVGYLREILEGVGKIRQGQLERHLGNVIEVDEFKEKVDRFKCLIEDYEDMH